MEVVVSFATDEAVKGGVVNCHPTVHLRGIKRCSI